MVFNKKQIKEIELGRENGVNVETYAKPEFNAKQMKELRLSLESNIDPIPYARPELTANAMREIRLCLGRGKDPSKYIDKDVYSPSQSRLLVRLLRKGKEMGLLVDPRFTVLQRYYIGYCISKGIPTSLLSDPNMPEDEMATICESLQTAKTDTQHLDTTVKIIREPDDVFDYKQKKVIKQGKDAGFDVSIYAKKYFMAAQMRSILRGLEAGVDVTLYAKPELTTQQMGGILRILKDKNKGREALEPYMNDFTTAQLGEIALGMSNHLDFEVYANPRLEPEHMHLLETGLHVGLDVTPYTHEDITNEELNVLKDAIRDKKFSKRNTTPLKRKEPANSGVTKMNLF